MTITRDIVIFGIMILFGVKGTVLVALALSSWKERIFFWTIIFIVGLVFATARLLR